MKMNGDHVMNNYIDVLTIKYNANNEVEWSSYIGGPGIEEIISISATSDDGYIIAGNFTSGTMRVEDYNINNNGGNNGLLIKYKLNENIDSPDKYVVDWAKSIGGTSNDYITSAIELNNGTILAGGYFESETIETDGKTLNNKGKEDGMLLKVANMIGVPEVEELEVKNYRKEFKITTDVEEIDGQRGGDILGENQNPYETVKYGDSSKLDITMKPEDNTYEIIKVTVNGVEQSFTPAEDGSYTLDKFDNVKEDKHVVVTYAKKSNKIVIKKEDSKTKEPIEGVEFKLDQVEERLAPTEDVLGPLTSNSAVYYGPNTEVDVTEDVLKDMIKARNYWFEQQEDGTYIPTNESAYTTANSSFPIDLNGKTGKYVVVIEASISAGGFDYGYATINNSKTPPSYTTSTGRFLYIHENQEKKAYVSSVIDGGTTKYLHIGYYRYTNKDTSYENQVVIYSIKVYEAKEVQYNFVNQNGEYKSNNQTKENTTANSYIPINLSDCQGKYNLSLKAKVSSDTWDYGYATVTTTDTAPSYNSNTSTRFVCISGTTDSEYKDYTITLDGGYQYYLHLGYCKSVTDDDGDDCFTVKDIKVTLNDSELYHTTVTTNSDGKGTTQVPLGRYTITEVNTSEGYIPLENPVTVDFKEDNKAIIEGSENARKEKNIAQEYIWI